jgi:hypothetical protein
MYSSLEMSFTEDLWFAAGGSFRLLKIYVFLATSLVCAMTSTCIVCVFTVFLMFFDRCVLAYVFLFTEDLWFTAGASFRLLKIYVFLTTSLV